MAVEARDLPHAHLTRRKGGALVLAMALRGLQGAAAHVSSTTLLPIETLESLVDPYLRQQPILFVSSLLAVLKKSVVI